MARKTTLEREASFARQRNALHTSDAFGVQKIDECRICKKMNVDAHKKYRTMCVECGKLYARYLKKGSKDSLTAGKRLVDRCSAHPNMETEHLIEQIKKQIKEASISMNEQKVCKQCGRNLCVDAYRKYVSRSKGIYNTTTSYHTVCKECENFNQQVNNAYTKPIEIRTPKQVELLSKAKILYEELHRRGLEPKGRYAAYVLGINIDKSTGSRTDNYFESIMNQSDIVKESVQANSDEVMNKGNELLSIELTEEPDVYQAMVDEWHDTIKGTDGRVKPEYLEIFNKVAERIDEYEDNYTW